jgi:CxxC motif-containing protein (DUF1111 family)
MPNKVIAYAEGRRRVTLGMSRFAALVLLGFVGAVAACGAGTAPAPDASVVGVDASLADVAEPRLDGSVDATTEALDAAPEDAGHADAGPADSGVPPTERIVPLFGPDTALEPALTEVTPTALITRFADRGRDRHAREDRFRAYEHYLPLYWEYRTVGVVIHDPIGRGGDTITFEVTTLWKLVNMQAELRLFYRGIGTVAEYHDNRPMTPLDNFHYRHQVSTNVPAGRPLQPGDRVEFEVSQFLDGVPRGRSAYYGTAYLYIVGQGLVPWIGSGARRDSEPIALSARLGGSTTVHANESNEPAYAFSQMATHLAPEHAQTFMRGRRLAHTSFVDGRHDESPDNPVWVEHAGKSGPLAITGACNDCHARNGRASPPEVGASLDQYVFRLGAADGGPDPRLGQVLQPRGGLEPAVRLTGWREARGLRRPEYGFQDPAPARSSARITPQLVGLGLLEAIPEASIVRLADPDDADGDGISGRASVVLETTTGLPRLGRFGYKAGQPTVRQQTAAALRTDMGVLTSVYPSPDCGAEQAGCGASVAELSDDELDALTLYVALLGVPAQRGFADADVVAGEAVFGAIGCDDCHVGTFTTSERAVHPELRAQVIRPFTDLLLHDLGPELADELGEGDTTGAEWRTAPLWGLGHTAAVSEAQGYLHDGRARTVEEAIRWHGGEASSARAAFEALDAAERAQLLRFLGSL